MPVHYHVPLSLGAVTSSCHVFRLLWHFLLSLSRFLFYCLSRICCALTTGFPYVVVFFPFHLLVWLFPPLCIDGLHISSLEFFPEPQTHIFRCYSWSHSHNLQGTLTYRCELPLTHRDTHIYTVCFNSVFPFLGNGLSIQLSKAEIIFRRFLLPH